MDSLRKFGLQLLQAWQSMSAPWRMAVALGAVVCLAVGGGWFWLAQPEYSVLFAGLAPEDAGAITSKLQAQGVVYRLGAGGSSILVPTEQVQQRRIEMAVEGLPAKGGKGYELFDQSSLGMTPFTEHVNYMRALQTELAKTIAQIEPVTYARVHIVRPDPSPFIRDQKPTTASVTLRLRPGATLNRNVAAGIVAVVARSVEGLTADNVTLVDTNTGKLLSEGLGSEGGSMGPQMDYRRELETYLASKAEGMLAQVLGAGHAIVRVTADINFQHMREKKETYSPDGRVATMEKTTSNKAGAASPAGSARGAAGTASNSGKQAAPAPPTGSTSAEETVETDFVVSKVTQEFEDKLGSVDRLTIAALVDLSSLESAKGNGSPAMGLADVQEIIKQAVGFKARRDEIKVSNVRLTPPTIPPPVEDEVNRLQYWHDALAIVRSASLGMAALVALILGWMVLRRIRLAASSGPANQVQAPPRVVEAINNNPEALARVLATWLDQSERQGKKAA
jgi:flagellar M-ring protein FliF